jgi:hypothetical protein
VAPGTTADLLAVVNRVLPQAEGRDRNRHLGRESETPLTRSPLTALGRKAARELNQETGGLAAGADSSPASQPA